MLHFALLLPGDHARGDLLREKIRTLEIDAHDAIVALLGCFKQIASFPGSDAGVVHQQIDAPERFFGEPQQLFAIFARGNIGATNFRGWGTELTRKLH